MLPLSTPRTATTAQAPAGHRRRTARRTAKTRQAPAGHRRRTAPSCSATRPDAKLASCARRTPSRGDVRGPPATCAPSRTTRRGDQPASCARRTTSRRGPSPPSSAAPGPRHTTRRRIAAGPMTRQEATVETDLEGRDLRRVRQGRQLGDDKGCTSGNKAEKKGWDGAEKRVAPPWTGRN